MRSLGAYTKVGTAGVTFNDLRGTAVACGWRSRGCTEAEIATITGHVLRDVRAILDAHYLHRDPALAESAIRKLERGTKIPDCSKLFCDGDEKRKSINGFRALGLNGIAPE